MKATIQAFILSAFCLTANAQTTAKEWQAKAVEKYPTLSVQGSSFNKRFVEAYTERRKTNPNFFANPKWPLTLADEVDEALVKLENERQAKIAVEAAAADAAAEKYRESEKVRAIEMANKKAERDQAEALVKLENERQAKIAVEAAAANAAAAAALDKATAKAEAEQAEKEKAAQEAAWKSTQKAAARSNNWWEVIGWAFGVLIVLLIIYPVIKLLDWGSLKRGDRTIAPQPERTIATPTERTIAPMPEHTEKPAKYGAVDLAADTAVGVAKFTFRATVLAVPFVFRTAGKLLGRFFKDDGKNR